jgi:hypothetical protein
VARSSEDSSEDAHSYSTTRSILFRYLDSILKETSMVGELVLLEILSGAMGNAATLGCCGGN